MTLSSVFGDKDTPKVQERLAPLLRMEASEVTLERVLTYEKSKVRAMLTPRQWVVLEAAVEAARLAFASAPKKPGLAPPVKAISDTWGRIYREETGETYRWDLARRVSGPDWMSKDWTALHEIEPALIGWVRGISPDSDYEDGALSGWLDDEREGPWVIALAERTMRGFIREFRTRGWGQGVHLQKFSEHLSKYLEAADLDPRNEAPAAFKPREVKSAAAAETDRYLEEYERRQMAGRR